MARSPRLEPIIAPMKMATARTAPQAPFAKAVVLPTQSPQPATERPVPQPKPQKVVEVSPAAVSVDPAREQPSVSGSEVEPTLPSASAEALHDDTA